ncbi:MAG: putative pyridoxine 5'-phosphate oxidase superfamily flavin-nucleotide-binding protein [Polaribacter sp.]
MPVAGWIAGRVHCRRIIMGNDKTTDASGYHRGERAAQARIGLAEKMAPLGPLILADSMPGQHRQFYEQLPWMFVSAADDAGDLWVSVLCGEPGFMHSPNAKTLKIRAGFSALDPIVEAIRPGADLGLLGIELETRRRNRLNARLLSCVDGELELEVKQSFGNCPKFIQRRELMDIGQSTSPTRTDFQKLDVSMQNLISQSDTLFIGSQFDDGQATANRGLDVSHRGGLPGFVRVEDAKTLLIPDYSGNNFFNTIGNLMLNAKAGILFLNFHTGSILSLTGKAEVVWAEDEALPFDQVDRMIRFSLKRGVQIHHLITYRWQFEDYSPFSLKY